MATDNIIHKILPNNKFHRYLFYILIFLLIFVLVLLIIRPSQYLCPMVPVEETVNVIQEEPYLAIEPGKIPLNFQDRAYKFEGYDNGDFTTIIKVFVQNTDDELGTYKVNVVLTNSTNTYDKEATQVIKSGEEKMFYFEQIEGRDNKDFNFTHSVTPSYKSKSVQVTKYRNITVAKVVTVNKRVCF